MAIDILLMAYGAAGSLDEIEPYLVDIRGGRPVTPELVAEVRRRYEAMGGRSPLLEITQGQARALEARLNTGGRGEGARGMSQAAGAAGDPPDSSTRFRVSLGMRHWHPYIKDAVAGLVAGGATRVVALPLTPYPSRLSIGAYFAKLDEACTATNASFRLTRIERWNDHPGFIEALSETVAAARDRFPAATRARVPVLFTAHSLPERILRENDPYPDALRATADAVAKRIGLDAWRIAYQSQGRTPEPWLGPEAGAVIAAYHAQGVRELVLAPFGFVSDHMETLYDVDVMYRDQARRLGLRLERAASLNTAPRFIDALADTVRAHLQGTA